ncbi:MAG: glycosyltransferase family 1 protein [Candidatus Cryptobacteroides sp.]
MKVMFIVFHNIVAHSGISKKILAQTEAFRENGAEVDLCRLEIGPDGSKCRVTGSEIICSFGSGLKAKLKKRMDYSDIVRSAEKGGYEMVYIRYDINADPFTVRLIKDLSKRGIWTVVEIPTWPYDGEFKGQGLMMNIQLLTDKLFRKRFFSFCDRIVLFNGPSTLYGKPTIRISNGVDFKSVPLSSHISPKDGTLRLLSVANIHLWHGLDRLISGMAAHRDIPCELHIVGDGLPEIIESYRTAAQESGVGDRVKILGPLYGEALDREFAWADMAVGSLGRHRSGITDIKTLKNREYAARGLAFFYSENDEDFDNAPFVFKVPADESPVDIGALANFLSQMTMTGEEIRESVRHLSWTEQMGKVLEDFKQAN